jgi:hypothetical protein
VFSTEAARTVQGNGQQKDSNVQLASGDIGGQNVKMTWLRLNE